MLLALDATSLSPGTRVERYEIIESIGVGAMGIVYRVRHVQLGTQHALKVLSWAHPQLQARLLTEGRVQATLNHPNVVSVTDMLQVAASPALLMEYIAGPSMEEWLTQHRPHPADAEALFRQIVHGVAAAHAAGIVHRDLKPSNVLMSRDGRRWVPKVTDFGLAKHADSDLGLTQSGVTLGTPAYMAPEQIREANKVDQRADIFALGCILYELVAGQTPHQGADNLSILNAVSDGSVTPVDSLVTGLPTTLSMAIRGAMAVNRDERFASCDELLACLDGKAARRPPPSEAINQPQPPTTPRWWRLTGTALSTFAVVLLASTLAFWIASPHRASRAPLPAAPIDLPISQPPPDPPDVSWPLPQSPSPHLTAPVKPPPVAALPTRRPATAPIETPAPTPTIGDCHGQPGELLGYTKVPRLFLRSPGTSWRTNKRRPVLAEPGSSTTICLLRAGQVVPVRDQPTRAHGSRWLAIFGDDPPKQQ